MARPAELTDSPPAAGKPPFFSCRRAIQATPEVTSAAATAPGASPRAMTAIAVLSTSWSPLSGMRLGNDPSAFRRLSR